MSHIHPEGPVFGTFRLMSYIIEDGFFVLTLYNNNPGGGMSTDWFIEFAIEEIGNMNQSQLAAAIKERLGWTYNRTHSALNTAINNQMTVTLP